MKLSFGQLARMADGSCVGSSGSTSVLVTTVGSDKPGSSQGFVPLTGKSLSEALIFASTNQQYDNRLFIELLTSSVQENYKFRTCCVHKLFFVLTIRPIYIHNMF